MKDNILTGTIKDKETGDTHDIEPSHWFPNGCELNAIVKILRVGGSHYYLEGSPSRMTNVDCLALDCQGNVFKLHLCFITECLEEEQKIILEITEGKILVVSGRYCVLPKEEFIIMLCDPKYNPLPAEYSLEEVEEVFRFNSASMLKDIHKAAEKGDANAQLPTKYSLEEILRFNSESLIMDIHKAAEQGDANSQCELGVMYQKGEGVKQSYDEAAKWYRKAAEQGHDNAQYNLGLMYQEGEGLKQSYSDAAKWFLKAAEQGHDNAQYNLGFMYIAGKGVPRDDAEAARWFRMAAVQGHENAQYKIGLMYEQGIGVEQDDAEAAKWYRMAALQENAEAQHKMGLMYEQGIGVEQDDAEAEEWYRLSKYNERRD